MATGREHATLLSDAQLEELRAQVQIKREAQFVAPQLLEQVVVLTGELRTTLAALNALREAIRELAAIEERLAPIAQHCPACSHPRVREAWAKLRAVLGPDDAE